MESFKLRVACAPGFEYQYLKGLWAKQKLSAGWMYHVALIIPFLVCQSCLTPPTKREMTEELTVLGIDALTSSPSAQLLANLFSLMSFCLLTPPQKNYHCTYLLYIKFKKSK